MHLVDIDNLLGDPRTTDRTTIQRNMSAYRDAAGYLPGDHCIVATGRNGLHVLEVELAWAAAAYRRRSGPDGADLALLEDLDWIIHSGRYDRVVIGSGDHAFLPAVKCLQAAQIDFLVVTRRDRLSARLAHAAGARVQLLEHAADTRTTRHHRRSGEIDARTSHPAPTLRARTAKERVNKTGSTV